MATTRISISCYPLFGAWRAHIVAKGVQQGRYDDLWERTLQLPPDLSDAHSILLGLVGALEDALGLRDGDSLPG